MATSTLAFLRRTMAWHAVRDEDFRSPIVAGMQRGLPVRRDRILSDDELRAFWKATEGQEHPYYRMARVILLTATRRDEAADLQWSEIQGDTWVIPAARYKTMIETEIPLSGAAQSVLADMPKIGTKGWVFTLGGDAFSPATAPLAPCGPRACSGSCEPGHAAMAPAQRCGARRRAFGCSGRLAAAPAAQSVPAATARSPGGVQGLPEQDRWGLIAGGPLGKIVEAVASKNLETTPDQKSAAASGKASPFQYNADLEGAKTSPDERAAKAAGMTLPEYTANLAVRNALAAAKGKRMAEAIEAGGKPARDTLNTLDIMGHAVERGGNNITTGPRG
jgi:hypothetical protein